MPNRVVQRAQGAAVVGLDPTGGAVHRVPRSAATRRPTLDGAVVGLVANGLGESEALLAAVYGELRSASKVAGAVPVLKGSVSVPPDPVDWERLTSEATVAICGFGG